MPPSPEQSEIAAAFETGRVSGVRLAAPRIDTHISHVFLTATRAYKLKRAVRLPFVDFSTLAQRHAACRAELDVNRRFAGEMYLAVRPVRRTGPDTYSLGEGDGEPLDWVVEMQRFDPSSQFDELAARGGLTPEMIDATADMIAAAHRDCPAVTSAGHTADYRGILHELRATETHGAHEQGLMPGEPDIFRELDIALARIDPLVEARRRAGKVRRTHGDLHLRNICLFNGRPTPFDALEFDERMATTDVLYDLAFLLMDLARIGHRSAAGRLMNRYWDMAGEDEAALAILPFFMALRAGVRMAVDIEAGKVAEADTYRQLARQLMDRAPPVALAIGGLSGSGKSTIARQLAPRLPGAAGARLLRSDMIRKRALDLNPQETLSAPGAYSSAARGAVYERLFEHGRTAFVAGCSVILDATFQEDAMRRALSTRMDPAPLGVWLDLPLDQRLARIAGRRADASDADARVARRQDAPEELPPGWHRIDASGTPEEVADRVMALVTS